MGFCAKFLDFNCQLGNNGFVVEQTKPNNWFLNYYQKRYNDLATEFIMSFVLYESEAMGKLWLHVDGWKAYQRRELLPLVMITKPIWSLKWNSTSDKYFKIRPIRPIRPILDSLVYYSMKIISRRDFQHPDNLSIEFTK